jgi:hypothetical protein
MKWTGSVLLLTVLLLGPIAVQSQTIRGVVINDETRAPIPGALVELVAPDASLLSSAPTDSAGGFVLWPGRASRFVVRVSHLAYAPLSSDTLSARAGEHLELEVRMAQTAIALEPLVVTARRAGQLEGFHERQRRGSLGRFLTREDIERRPGARASDLLRTMPGVQIVPAGGSGGVGTVNLVTMRGGTGRCLATIYLNGMMVRQFPESGVDDLIHPDMLEGVEVYTSFASAPSPIHSQNGCGVVAFWTRPATGGRWSWRKMFAGVGGFVLLLVLAR